MTSFAESDLDASTDVLGRWCRGRRRTRIFTRSFEDRTRSRNYGRNELGRSRRQSSSGVEDENGAVVPVFFESGCQEFGRRDVPRQAVARSTTLQSKLRL